ncbi:MAG: hypothetical protein AB3N15_05885 [Paracoccaceae bacterium]
MRDRVRNTFLFVISYAITFLNTMPIWLAELAHKTGGGSITIGLTASLVLISAAIGCFIGPRVLRSGVPAFCGGIVFLGLLASSSASAFDTAMLIPGAALVGLASGVVLSIPLSAADNGDSLLRMFGQGMSLGCVASLVVLASTASTGFPLLPVLSGLAGIQMVILLQSFSAHALQSFQPAALRRDLNLFPFFVLMGSYWAFLEVFALERGLETVSGWLAASLVLSALGSLAASVAPDRIRHVLLLLGLGLAALAGGLTYLSVSEVALGMMILCNAFGLFLFFPLYLDDTDMPGFGMARYLLGFALGGGVGSLIITFGGYRALAFAIIASGLIALPKLWRGGFKPRAS